MMSRARRPGQRPDSATSSCREGIPAPATDHHGPRIWTWLTVSSLRRLGRPVRIGVNLAGAAGAALFAQAPAGGCALPVWSPGRQYPYPLPPELEDWLGAGAAAPEMVTSCHTPPERFSPFPLACPGAVSPE